MPGPEIDDLLAAAGERAMERLVGGSTALDEAQVRSRLEMLRTEHRDLDEAIAALAAGGVPDQLHVARLKKRKLRLRDEIAALGDTLIPDIIA